MLRTLQKVLTLAIWFATFCLAMAARAAFLFSPYKLFEYALSICGFGAVAQLGERLPRTEEAGGSSPLCSTKPSRNVEVQCGLIPAIIPVVLGGEPAVP